MLSSYRQPIFGALRDQASDVILTGIPEQQRAKMRDRRISDQPESGKHDEVLQMFSLNVDLLTNLPIRPFTQEPYSQIMWFEPDNCSRVANNVVSFAINSIVVIRKVLHRHGIEGKGVLKFVPCCHKELRLVLVRPITFCFLMYHFWLPRPRRRVT